MGKVILLGLTILFGAVFLVIPANNNPALFAMFPLAPKATITIQTYVYFIFEHFVVLALSFIIASEARTYVPICRAFFWIQVADLADYLLTYNSVWFELGRLPISMNVVKVVVFAIFVVKIK